jgi:hypothetical protein
MLWMIATSATSQNGGGKKKAEICNVQAFKEIS